MMVDIEHRMLLPPYTHLPHLPHRPHHRIQPITWVTSRVKSRAILSPVESEHAKSRLVINARLGEFRFISVPVFQHLNG